MYIKINKAKIVEGKYWNNVFINQVWLYDDNWKWIKWAKINDALVTKILEAKIKI